MRKISNIEQVYMVLIPQSFSLFVFVIVHWGKGNIQHLKDCCTQDICWFWYSKTQSVIIDPCLECVWWGMYETANKQIFCPYVNLGQQTSLVVFFIPQFIIIIDIFWSWQNPLIGSLFYGMWASIVLIFYTSAALKFKKKIENRRI